MKWNRVAAIATAVGVAIALTACGAATVPSSKGSAGAGGKYRIALVPGMTAHPFYITMHKGAEKGASDLGVDLIYQGAAKWTVEDQNRILDTILIEKPDALLVVPTDSKGSAAGIRKFVDAGIPVFTVDTNIDDDSLYLSNISGNNLDGGALAADAIATAAGGSGKVAIIGTNPGTSVDELRAKGFTEEMAKKYPNIQVVAHEYGGEDPTGGQRVAEGLMLAHPDLVGIFGVNGYMATGAANAIAAAGKTGRVALAGYDADPALVKQLRAGAIEILVAQQPAEMAKVALGFAVDYLDGKKKTFDKAVTIPNVLVTTKNVDDAAVSPYLYDAG